MERIALAALACGAAAAAWMVANSAPQESAAEADASLLQDAMTAINRTFQRWRPPAAYADLIAQAEDDNGIPRDLLARLLYQESHWRADVINGATRSRVGALGIAQFMPATAREWGVDPLDPPSAIDGAGRYLAWLRARTASWAHALAAYNWGLGNVQRRGLDKAPAETRAYFAGILADVNAANGTAWA